MRFKDSTVNPLGMRVELLVALVIADGIYAKAGTEMVLTSLNDGQHSLTSLHYSGCAADLRTRNLENVAPQIVATQIKDALSGDYDVLLEGRGTSNEHLHIEWQRRRPQ